MPLLTLDAVSLAYGHLPLFEGASLQIEAGERIALIGRNGSGKSSLLKVLAGDVPPDAGSVWRAPGLRVSRLDQDVPLTGTRTVFEEISSGLGELGALVSKYHEAAVAVAETGGAAHDRALDVLGQLQHQLEERDGWSLEQKVELVISRLSLPADRKVGELSGGWRRRALLGKALVSQPDVLLLDEPTNHLDIDAIRWLEEYSLRLRARSSSSPTIAPSSRILPPASSNSIAARSPRGPAGMPRTSRRKRRRWRTRRVTSSASTRNWRKRKPGCDKASRRACTRNEGRVKALFELRARRAAHREQSGNVRMAIDAAESSGKLVFEAEGVGKSLGGVPIIRNYSQRIVRGDRIGLIGPNGSGKTTVLRLLVGELEADEGSVKQGARLQIAYYDQQREQLDPDRSVADSVNDGNSTVSPNGQPRHIIGYLADFLFPRERAMSPVKSLSGGERNRLLLARLFAKPANVLVLDEPTNDLDIETLELLEELIGDFDGTVLLVSHDRAFLDNIVTSTLAFEGEGRVVEYVGGYQDYLRQSMSTEHRVPNPEPRGPNPEPRTPNPGIGKRKLSYNERRELEALPPQIEALETEIAALRAESESPNFYKAGAERIREVLTRTEVAGKELERTLARWMELEERA